MSLPTLFLDTSVLIAAMLSSTGGSFQLCGESHEGRIRLRTNRYVGDEITEVLQRKYPYKADAIPDFLTWSSITLDRNPSRSAVQRVLHLIHPEDAPVLAGALRAKADFLVSLDRKDFLTDTLLDAQLPIRIVTPQMFFQEYRDIS